MAAPGELWSLSDEPIVVAIVRTADVLADSVVVSTDDDSNYQLGEPVIVRLDALACRWTVKPLTGVAREPTP